MNPMYFSQTHFYASTNAKILSFIPPHDRRILEWGCAHGDLTSNLARKLPRSSIYAVEDEPSLVESLRGQYASQEFRNVVFEVAQLDEIGEFVTIRHLQLDVIILSFILHRLGNREKKLNLFKDIASLPASPKVIVTGLFQLENPTEKALRKFWDERAAEMFRYTFWHEFTAEMEKDYNMGEARRIAQQAGRKVQELELEYGKQLNSKEDQFLVSESDLEQIAAEAGFSHIFHEKADAWGNSIFVIQK